jgi:hypothetical protein
MSQGKSVAGARIVTADILAGPKGIIHIVDGVLVPPEGADIKAIADFGSHNVKTANSSSDGGA